MLILFQEKKLKFFCSTFLKVDMDEEQCCICHESLKNGKQVFELPECKHKYHTSCIGAWWCAPRDRHNPEGSCPLCRNPTFKKTTIWRWNTRKGRVALLKRLAKKDQAPKPIIKVIQKLNKAKKEYQEALKKQRAYSKKHMEIFKMDRKLRGIRWKKQMRMNHVEAQLAAFDPMALINLIN